ncbi:MAG: protein kinase [Planctomycetes bacterium]|nr:protein kinase [Planctomycetota bacterium]
MKPVDLHPPREQLAAFLAGELSSADLTSVTAHVEVCEACCQVLRELPEGDLVPRLQNAADKSPAEAERILPREMLEHPKYKIGRFLGRGGMGAVYQAEHLLMNRQVALKIIHRELIKHERVIERFRLEVKAAAQLAHPNIVTAYDAEQAGELHFLVMEYVDGMSLARLVAKKGPLDVRFACNFIRQAARGLQHAFEVGMVHRDIKPHNLMLTRKATVKILDFGLARLASESRAELGLPPLPDRPGLTKIGDLMGTPEFMPPEQFSNPGGIDIRADIYSLGCTLYYLLTGKTPFDQIKSRAEMLSPKTRMVRPIQDVRMDLPASLIGVIEKMMAHDPAQRYATPAEVFRALAPADKAAPESPAPPPTPAPVAPAAPAVDPNTFMAQCPFCKSRFRIPANGRGASVACPTCKSFFTVVPMDEPRR